MWKIISLLLMISLFVPAWANKDNSQVIKTVLNDQRDAWNQGDLKRFMDAYWRSPLVTFASSGTVRKGWDNVYERYLKTYGNKKESMGNLDFSNLVVTPLGDEAALVYGRWALIKGNEKLGGIFSLVMRKFPDGWKIIHDHTSRDEPQTEKPQK